MNEKSIHPDAGYVTAQKRIADCRKNGTDGLNLSSLRLTKLPVELFQLKTLTTLYLFNNQLAALPSDFAILNKLTRLHLFNNKLTALPPDFANLNNLTHLHLGNNQLTALPPDFPSLNNLTFLALNNNQFTALPPNFANLTALAYLSLDNNQLTALPDNLRALPLKRLFLHDNPKLKIPPSILGPHPATPSPNYASAKSILDFYYARQTDKTRPLNEVKLILVGRGGAGKTSIVRALKKRPFQPEEKSTPGIALCDWKMTQCKHGTVKAHIWDFAGQVITHALHQFFFSERSVYILVLTGRENNERNDAEYWLRLIKGFGTDTNGNGPPVIIALNKWKASDCRPKIDRRALQERYPFIRGFVETDCKSNFGIADLEAMLSQEVDHLKWVRDPFPQKWDNIRRALASGKKSRPHLTYRQYRDLCAEHGVNDPGLQDSLAEILHNLGAALNYRNDPRLREATVLQPAWLTQNVYALMRRAQKHEGLLLQADVDAVLKQEKDPHMRAYLMRLMERFEITYSPRTAGGQWLVPQALPDQQPTAAEKFHTLADATRLSYTYPALPEGLVARAIVRLHEFIEEVHGTKQQWASGAILAHQGARALLRTQPHDSQVMITITGPAKERQQLAGLCRTEMRDIHAEIHGLNPTEETQVNDEWVSTKTLEGDEKKGQLTGIPTNTGTQPVNPTEPNNAYSTPAARNDKEWKPKVFISYSKSDITQRKSLESQLKILKNEGLLAAHWHDRMIDPGDSWNAVIQEELATADVIILLVTTEALATDYIIKHEIPKALQLHAAKTTVLIPVILKSCLWERTDLRHIAALPEKARPINTWKHQSDAWKSVADGLIKVLEKLKSQGPKNRPNSPQAPESQPKKSAPLAL